MIKFKNIDGYTIFVRIALIYQILETKNDDKRVWIVCLLNGGAHCVTEEVAKDLAERCSEGEEWKNYHE